MAKGHRIRRLWGHPVASSSVMLVCDSTSLSVKNGDNSGTHARGCRKDHEMMCGVGTVPDHKHSGCHMSNFIGEAASRAGYAVPVPL